MPVDDQSGRRKVNNLLALAVLSHLRQGPMHPYELARTLREHGDTRSIKFNHGSLYMVVGQLAKAGFITEQDTTRAGRRPERTIYALTEAGQCELTDWLRQLISQPQHEYPAFVSALSLLAALPPSEAVSLLNDRLERLAQQRTEIERLIKQSRAEGVADLFLVEEKYRLAVLRAEVKFVRSLIGDITDPNTAWMAAWADFHGENPTKTRKRR